MLRWEGEVCLAEELSLEGVSPHDTPGSVCYLSQHMSLLKIRSMELNDLGAGVLSQEQLCPWGYLAKSTDILLLSRHSMTTQDTETQNHWPKVSIKPGWEPGP